MIRQCIPFTTLRGHRREREKERIQRIKDAQKRLEEIRTRIQEETVNDFSGDKMITLRPLFSREVKALETLIERNQRWVTKPRKKSREVAHNWRHNRFSTVYGSDAYCQMALLNVPASILAFH